MFFHNFQKIIFLKIWKFQLFSTFLAKIWIFSLRMVWKLEIFSTSSIFLNFYIKKNKIWGFFIQNLENLTKILKISNFWKNLSFQFKFVKIWSKSIIFLLEIEKNTRFRQNYPFLDHSLAKNWDFSQKSWEKLKFPVFTKNYYFEN